MSVGWGILFLFLVSLGFFILKGCWMSTKDFPASTEMIKWFLILSLFIDSVQGFLTSSQNSPHTTLFLDHVPIAITRLLVRALMVANLFVPLTSLMTTKILSKGVFKFWIMYRRLKNIRNLPELALPNFQDSAIGGTTCKVLCCLISSWQEILPEFC